MQVDWVSAMRDVAVVAVQSHIFLKAIDCQMVSVVNRFLGGVICA